MAKRREQIKIFFIERKWWTAAACLCLAAAMFYAVNYPAAVGAAAAARQLPIYCVQRDQKLVSISFDAAWGDAILRQGFEGVRCFRKVNWGRFLSTFLINLSKRWSFVM